jgi:amino acid permease
LRRSLAAAAAMPTPSRGALAQTAAVSVATILGSGILGLPVSLAASGLPPFVLFFTVTMLAQFAVVYATTELLQRASVAKRAAAAHKRRLAYERIPYQAANGAGADGVGDARDGNGSDGSVRSGGSAESAGREESAPGLHSFAEFFLPGVGLKALFELAVLFHFVSIMSSYALGAPQAFREVVPVLKAIPETATVLAFTVGAAVVVVFFGDAVVVPLTLATFVKGTLLTVMVFFVLAVGLGVGVQPTTNWAFGASVEPFLMGTLALSGVINLMPKLWDICVKSTGLSSQGAVDRDFVVSFRGAVNGAVVLCYVLNVMWCVGVLMVVPQTGGESAAASGRQLAAGVLRALSESATVANGTSAVTLAKANELGQISTVPLVEVLKGQTHGAAAEVVINMVNVFIFISISVSFMVMGLGLTQMTDEMAESAVDWFYSKRQRGADGSRLGRPTQGVRRGARLGLAAAFFAAVSTISATNPKALLHIMAGFTSLALNLEGGVLIIIMFLVSRGPGATVPETRPRDASLDYVAPSIFNSIPAPIPRGAGWVLVVFVMSFFSFAVVVDVAEYLPTIFG